MSRLNAARIVNLSYNRNTMRINNETFEFGGENTLVSLRNGGGKTVMVQMLLAPFVRRRNLKDRIFTDYFTGSSPTYIMTEWLLDNSAGYVLIGMAVRKKTLTSDEDAQQELDIITFVHEYMSGNDYDIHNIPIIEQTGNIMRVKPLSEAKKLMEELRSNRRYSFDFYDLSVDNQRKKYYERLKEFNIHQKEWEGIIQKINTKESGLSELFSKSKTVTALVGDWFLPAIEDKLNEHGNRIRGFQQILNKFIIQLKENESKLELKKGIEEFRCYSDKIMQAADELEIVLQEICSVENDIAGLYRYIMKKIEELEGEGQRLSSQKSDINNELLKINYEKLSYDYYLVLDKIQEQREALKELLEALEALEMNKEETERELGRIKCSKLYNDYLKSAQEVLTLENKIESFKRSDEEKQQACYSLGYSLNIVYSQRAEEMDTLCQVRVKEIASAKEKLKEDKQLSEYKNNNIKEFIKGITEARLRIDSFNKYESDFKSQYTDFIIEKNIIDEYDAEALKSYEDRLRKQKDNAALEGHKKADKKAEAQKRYKEQSTYLNELQFKKLTNSKRSEEVSKTLQGAEADCEKIKRILRYCNVEEQRLFDKPYITNQLESIIKLQEQDRDNLQREMDRLWHLEELYESGKNIKLPDEFEKGLKEFGIPLLYGLTWLTKQPIALEKKLNLIKQNPFLPYSIIMDSDSIELLRKEKLDIYTSLPIPIVEKNKLDKCLAVQVVNNLYTIESLNFYISFNEKLLDEKELKNILLCIKKSIEQCRREKEIKIDEIKKYTVDLEDVKRFSTTSKDISGLKQEIEKLKVENKRLVREETEVAAELITLEELTKTCEEEIEKWTEAVRSMEQQQKEFSVLVAGYGQYKQERVKEKALSENINNLNRERQELIIHIEQEESRINALSSELIGMKQTYHNYMERQQEYASYREGTRVLKDLEELEAEYKALKSELGLEVQEYSGFLNKERQRFKELEEELIKCQNHYKLSEQEYTGYIYDSAKAVLIESRLKVLDEELRNREKSKIEEEKTLALLDKDKENRMEKVTDVCDREYPVPREHIHNLDFKGRRKIKEEELRLCINELDNIEASKRYMTANLDKLESYKELGAFGEELLEVSDSDIEVSRDKLIKTHKGLKNEENNKRVILADCCNELASNFNFKAEIYFKNSIEMLIETKHRPEETKQILTTIREIHQRTMLQLQSDLDRIDEERMVVTNSLLDYTEEIYKNMNTIDVNSTIKIEDRPYKMLIIEQPDWQKEIFMLKLKDFIDRVINECRSYLDLDKSIDDTLEKEVTTAKLYDYIVGINNVNVKLRKIETSGVVPISWNEVAQNSGGEGFVSAFIILISLLSYMRREEDTLVHTKEAGKILIMDNPFAQTNAEHLLKPLTDIAKKYNTQLICYTGLGGDSIYNRFDNIYVLNLYDSKLHQGVQVLESEHKKGEELTQMTSTRFLMKNEKYEQVSLF